MKAVLAMAVISVALIELPATTKTLNLIQGHDLKAPVILCDAFIVILPLFHN